MRESLIKKFNARMDAVETRLKRLECPHDQIGFRNRESPFYYCDATAPCYMKICRVCGKVLDVYLTRESFLAAKADHAEEEFIALRQKLDEERAAIDHKAKKAKA